MTDRLDDALETLRQNEERFRRMFEHSNDAIFLIDPEADAILDANEKASLLLGYARGELLTVPPSVIHRHGIERFRAFTRSVLERGSGWTAELSCRCKSGEVVPAEISASLVEVGGGRRLLAIVRDVSERKRLEEERRRHAEQLELLVEERTAQLRRSEQMQRVLLEINNALVTCLDEGALLEAIAATLKAHIPLDRVAISLYDPETDTLEAKLVTGEPPGAVTIRPAMGVPSTDNRWRWLETMATEIRHDVAVDPYPAERLALREGIRSYVNVPFVSKRGVKGAFTVASGRPGQYSAEHGAFLERLAPQISLAVDNMLAYGEIARLKAKLEEENVYLREEARSERGLEGIIGDSRAIRRVKQAVATVAGTEATVLITGETGTGKELVARAIHEGSSRSGKTMVKVNCAALPASLIESELFGHEKGAFTGALTRKAGRFELADGGTIFLDEVGDLPHELQAKLLRVLQEGEFERVGGTQTLKVRVRLVAATNQDLQKALESGRFRADLYYRLNVFPIAVPPLRERKEDIPVLVRHLVMRNAARLSKRMEGVPDREMDALVAYGWPGNVRELANVVERAVILSRGPMLELADCLPAAAPVLPSGSKVKTLAELERSHLLEVLEATRGRVSGPRGAARLLGIKPTTLESRIRRHGIQKPR